MRTDDRALIDAWASAWADLVRFEVIPVRGCAQAAALMRARETP